MLVFSREPFGSSSSRVPRSLLGIPFGNSLFILLACLSSLSSRFAGGDGGAVFSGRFTVRVPIKTSLVGTPEDAVGLSQRLAVCAPALSPSRAPNADPPEGPLTFVGTSISFLRQLGSPNFIFPTGSLFVVSHRSCAFQHSFVKFLSVLCLSALTMARLSRAARWVPRLRRRPRPPPRAPASTTRGGSPGPVTPLRSLSPPPRPPRRSLPYPSRTCAQSSRSVHRGGARHPGRGQVRTLGVHRGPHPAEGAERRLLRARRLRGRVPRAPLNSRVAFLRSF